jgi:hypothetical protein
MLFRAGPMPRVPINKALPKIINRIHNSKNDKMAIHIVFRDENQIQYPVYEISDKNYEIYFQKIFDIFEQKSSVFIDPYGDSRLYTNQLSILLILISENPSNNIKLNAEILMFQESVSRFLDKSGLFLFLGD